MPRQNHYYTWRLKDEIAYINGLGSHRGRYGNGNRISLLRSYIEIVRRPEPWAKQAKAHAVKLLCELLK